ncbi:questin oxidase family protein [Mangrovicoccus sp. HB161399]|uniref:questin oxidase family protein n=1 Tax=Mangrovicoccus sp. HB161399 TaxID=2720392 RepID=UPI001C12E5DD|nr:questin oxidase family protein [Mangrovicoccus sp. HB161399]
MDRPAPQQDVDGIMAAMPAYSTEFAETFANHAPMVLVALDRIGGGADRLHDFFRSYEAYKVLLPVQPGTAPLTAADLPALLGAREREDDLRRYFAAEVDRLGWREALAVHLPGLASGVGASALHALMRTAYGILREDPQEIAIALAYWHWSHLALPPATGAAPVTADPAEVLARAGRIDALRALPLHGLLWQNMAESGRCAGFAPVVDWLEIGPDTLDRMAAASIALFAATQDFSALHAVTGCHWLRIVLPCCSADTQETMLRSFWQCIAALSGEMGFPALPSAARLERWRMAEAPDWPAIFAAARLSDDEHDISVAFSASEEDRIRPDPLYRVSVARRLGLIRDYRT